MNLEDDYSDLYAEIRRLRDVIRKAAFCDERSALAILVEEIHGRPDDYPEAAGKFS